jgi:hypothetical protein
MVVAGGGGTRWTGVRQSASTRREEKTEVGRERKTEVEMGELVGGALCL